MKITKLLPILLSALIVCGCADKGATIDLPAPSQKQEEQEQGKEQGQEQGQGQGQEHEWDANRGKVVTPSGANWTSKTIDEGVLYYTYTSTGSVKQQVFAVDLDLSKTGYEVKLVYTSPRKVTSEAFLIEPGTVAAMNANYELGSIYMRIGGSLISNLPNTEISTTGVPNWKSEAAFSTDRKQGVKFFYAGSQKKGEMTVDQQRSYYNSIPANTAPDLISSAPMLINDYNPIGVDFCDYSISTTEVNKLNSEHPERHQRTRHPRSAVALTENNHFIMLIVDGRNDHSAGMSARELTNFLVNNFNPQYALNMDGGGSTCMCVVGEGDPDTHVVNYPCDNGKYDHAGERSRDAHFVIVKK